MGRKILSSPIASNLVLFSATSWHIQPQATVCACVRRVAAAVNGVLASTAASKALLH